MSGGDEAGADAPLVAAALSRAAASARAAASELADAGARDEALARYDLTRRFLMVPLPPKMVSLGRVWRLGVLLLGKDGRIHATGSTTRARQVERVGYASVSAELRDHYRAAALRAGYAVGETVNFDAPEVALTPDGLRDPASPLVLRDGEVTVRWSPSAPDATPVPLDAYLRERVELLVHPPLGA